MKLGNKGQVKTWLVGLLASAIVVTGGFFNYNLDEVLAALPSRLNDRQMQTFVDLGFNQAATRVVISGGQLMLDSTVNIEIGNVEPRLDNTDIQAVSLWARNVTAGDTSVFVDSDGHLQVDILSPTVAGDSAGASSDEGFLMIGAVTGNGFEHEIVSVDPQGHLQVDIITGGSMVAGAEQDVDDPAGATDTGNVILVVRDNVLTTLTPVDNDYVRLRVDARGAQWVHNDPVDAQLDLQVAASATADGTTIDVSGVNLVLVHLVTDGTWDRSGSLFLEGFMGVSPNPVERLLPYIEFQGEGSGTPTDPIGRRAQAQALTTISSSELGFLVDVRGFQGFRARISVTGGSAGTVTIHAHLVKNSEGTFNAAMALVQTSDGQTGVPDFSMLVVGESGDGLVVNLGNNNDVTVSSSALPTGAATEATLLDIADVLSADILDALTGHEGDFQAVFTTQISRNVDSIGGATDGGIPSLVLRDNVLTTLTPVEGDYVRKRVDEVGALYARSSYIETIHHNAVVFTAGSDSSTGTDAAVHGMSFAAVTLNTTGELSGAANILFRASQDGTNFRTIPVYDWDESIPLNSGTIPLVAGVDRFLIDLRGMTVLRIQIFDTNADGVTFTATSTAVSGDGLHRTEMAVFPQNAVSDAEDAGIPSLAKRVDALTSGSAASADGNYGNLLGDEFGAVWTNQRVPVTQHHSITFTGGDETSTGVEADVTGMSTVMVSVNRSGIVGDYNVTFRVTQDGLDWRTFGAYSRDRNQPNSIASFDVADIGSDDRFLVDVRGAVGFRVEVFDTSATAGTLDISSSAIQGSNFSYIEMAVFDESSNNIYAAGDHMVSIAGVIDSSLTNDGVDDQYEPPRLDGFGGQWSRLYVLDGEDSFIPLQGAAGSLQTIVQSVIPGTFNTALGKAEDDLSASGETGVVSLVVRDDVLVADAEVSADGDFAYQRVDNFGSGWSALTADDGVRIPASSTDGLLVNTELPAAAVLGDSDANPTTPLIGAALMIFNPCNGTWERSNTDGSGILNVQVTGGSLGVTSVIPGTGQSFLGKAEDNASGNAEVGVASMTVRDDVLEPDAAVSADGDYTFTRVDNTGATWVRSATVTEDLFIDATVSGTSTTVDVAGYTMAMIHYETDGTWDRQGTWAVNLSIGSTSPFKPAVGAIEVRQAGGKENAWRHVDPESISLNAVTNRIRGYMINVMGFQALQVELTITIAGTTGSVDYHVHLYSSGSGFNQEMSLGTDTTITEANGGPPPLIQFVGGMSSGTPTMRALFLPSEDAASADADAGIPTIVIRDDVLTANAATNADLDYTMLRVDNFGAIWTTQTNGAGVAARFDFTDVQAVSLYGDDGEGGEQQIIVDTGTGAMFVDVRRVAPGVAPTDLGKAVDAVGGAADTGVASLVLRDDVLTTLTPVDGDYVRSRVDAFGSGWSTLTDAAGGAITGTNGHLEIRSMDSTSELVAILEDEASGNGESGFPAMVIRDDALVANAEVSADGDYLNIRVDNFGAVWGTPTDGAGNILAQIEDVAHVTGDPGIASLFLVQNAQTTNAAVGDYSLPVITTAGRQIMVLVRDSNIGVSGQAVKREDDPSNDSGSAVAMLVVRDDALTAGASVGADGDFTFIRVDNVGAVWMQGSTLEDSIAGDGDGGLGALGVINGDLTVLASEGDYTFVSLSSTGAMLGMPVYDATIGATVRATDIEDQAPGQGHAGLIIFHERDDVLAANAGVSTDGDLVYPKADNFGALWTHENNAVQELGITELIGINEQVDAAEYGGSVTTTLAGTGAITKVCLVATEDGSGAVLKPNGTLILFDTDPTITFGDAAITAGERLTILAQLTFSDTDYQEDANGASNCQATEEIFHTSTVFASWFLASGEPSFNDVAGDDEQLEMNVWYRRDSL